MPLPVVGLAIGSAVLRAVPFAGPALARYAPRMANWLHIDAAVGGANTVAAADMAHEAKNLAGEVGGLASDVAGAGKGAMKPEDAKGVQIEAMMGDSRGTEPGQGRTVESDRGR